MQDPAPWSELAESVEETLKAQARRNERTIARVRVVTLALVTALDLLIGWQPPGVVLPEPVSLWNAALAASWLTVAVVIERALVHGFYRDTLRIALPLLDGVILLSLFICVLLTVTDRGHVAQALVNVGIGGALLTVTGALRLHKAAVWTTTGAAVVTFMVVAGLAGQPWLHTLFSCALLVGVGFLGMWMNEVTRHSLRSEIGRLVLGRFLPQGVVDGAHEAPLALVTSPRRMDATVLVTDVRGFTALAESMPPEQVLALLNGVQGALAEAVVRHGGTVDKFMGDGMLAVFGLQGQSTHARDALCAAQDMLAAIARLPAGPGAVHIGVGIHSGPVVAGCLGSGLRMEFTVLGDTVNTAARLQDETKAFGVALLASGSTQQAAGDAGASMTSLGRAQLRGRESDIAVFTLPHEVHARRL